jgi:hypothetical protein
LCLSQTIACEIDDLLTLRREYDGRKLCADSLLHRPQHKTFPDSSSSPKKADEVRRTENRLESAALIFGEVYIVTTCAKPIMLPDSLACRFDNLPFACERGPRPN